jgi:hypothetical protein
VVGGGADAGCVMRVGVGGWVALAAASRALSPPPPPPWKEGRRSAAAAGGCAGAGHLWHGRQVVAQAIARGGEEELLELVRRFRWAALPCPAFEHQGYSCSYSSRCEGALHCWAWRLSGPRPPPAPLTTPRLPAGARSWRPASPSTCHLAGPRTSLSTGRTGTTLCTTRASSLPSSGNRQAPTPSRSTTRRCSRRPSRAAAALMQQAHRLPCKPCAAS